MKLYEEVLGIEAAPVSSCPDCGNTIVSSGDCPFCQREEQATKAYDNQVEAWDYYGGGGNDVPVWKMRQMLRV